MCAGYSEQSKDRHNKLIKAELARSARARDRDDGRRGTDSAGCVAERSPTDRQTDTGLAVAAALRLLELREVKERRHDASN